MRKKRIAVFFFLRRDRVGGRHYSASISKEKKEKIEVAVTLPLSILALPRSLCAFRRLLWWQKKNRERKRRAEFGGGRLSQRLTTHRLAFDLQAGGGRL